MNAFLRENRLFIGFILCFGLLRAAVADYSPIPSGSMHPNLLEGDVVLINRVAFDLKVPFTDVSLARLGEPQRGDIVTFYSEGRDKRIIKRLVGIPGDTIEMRDKRILINGRPADYVALGQTSEPYAGRELAALQLAENFGEGSHRIQWLPIATGKDSFAPMVIPQDQYLMLGDNRDNSADSRFIGLIPRRLLIGRAHHVLVSADILGNWRPRVDRFGRSLN